MLNHPPEWNHLQEIYHQKLISDDDVANKIPVVIVTSLKLSESDWWIGHNAEGKSIWRNLHQSLIRNNPNAIHVVTNQTGHHVPHENNVLFLSASSTLVDNVMRRGFKGRGLMATVASYVSVRQVLLWLLSVPLLMSSVLAAEKPVLRWCLDHFPGMHEFNGDHRIPVGPSVEMMQELARLADFTLIIGAKTPVSRCFKKIADGEADVMVNLLHSNERAKTINLIRFASRHPDRLYMAHSNPIQIQDLNQIRRLSLVTVRNFGLHPTIQAVVGAMPARQKQQVGSTLIALEMIAKGRAEGTLLPPTTVKLLLNQHAELAAKIREIEFRDDNILPQDIYLGFSRKITDPRFLARIELALQQMKDNGTMHRLFGDKILQ